MRQTQVHCLAALAVSVTGHADAQVTAKAQDLGDIVDHRLGGGCDAGRAGIKGDLAPVGHGNDLGDALLGRWQGGDRIQRLDIGDVQVEIGRLPQLVDHQPRYFGGGGFVACVAANCDCLRLDDDNAIGQFRQRLDPGKDADRPTGGQVVDDAGAHGDIALTEFGGGEIFGHHIGQVVGHPAAQLDVAFGAQRGGELRWASGLIIGQRG